MKVLIVDDNRDAAMSLSMLTSLWGHDSRIAYDGQEALELADDFVPDVVLLDLAMPRMDGFEACRQIRERVWGDRVAVIAITGFGGAEDHRKTDAASFDRHLVKPVDADVLAQELTAVEKKLG